MFHHISNVRLIESLSDMTKEMTSLLSKAEETAKKFTAVCKNRRGYSKSSAAKKRKNDKKNENRKEHIFQKKVELMVNYLLSEEGQKMYKEGEVIYDSDLKVDRELPISITASRVRHLVHLLNTGNFTHQARCTLVDLVPSNLTTQLLSKMDDDDDQEGNQNSSDGSSAPDITQEEGL